MGRRFGKGKRTGCGFGNVLGVGRLLSCGGFVEAVIGLACVFVGVGSIGEMGGRIGLLGFERGGGFGSFGAEI